MTSLVSGEAGRGQLGGAVSTAGAGSVVGSSASSTDLTIVDNNIVRASQFRYCIYLLRVKHGPMAHGAARASLHRVRPVATRDVKLLAEAAGAEVARVAAGAHQLQTRS